MHPHRRLLTGLAVALTLILQLLYASAAHAAEGQPSKLDQLKSGQTVLRVGTDATFPPFEFTKPDGTMVGFDIELVRALADQIGIQRVEFQQLPFGNIVPALQADQIDMGASAIYISDEREQAVDFSNVYYPGGLALFVAEDNDEIASLADTAGKTIAVQVGTKSVEWLKANQPKAELVTVQTNQQMFDTVRLGQADAVVTGAPAGQYFIAQRGGLKMVGDRLTKENYGYAFQADDPELKEAFNDAIAEMKVDGSYDKLTEEWFGSKETEKKEPRGIINPSTITGSWFQILKGVGVTLLVISLSLLLSLFLGTLGGLGRLTHVAPLRWLANSYVSVVRGTPFVVQLFFIYFGLPQLGLQLPPLVAGIVSLGLYSGSYITEIFRGSVQSIDAGQLEAARSCGMSQRSAMRRVILPQAFLRMLPPLGNEFVSMTKNSALVSFITIHELFLVGQTIIARTFDALTVYLFIGFLYYLITNAIGLTTRSIEKKMAVYI